jgi:hypothetical protein
MKPNRIHWIILYLFISLLTIAQGTNHQQKLNKKIDSAIQIINQQSDRKVKEYQRKTDSLNSAAYIQALERANTIQSGNNAYYSILFGGFGLMEIPPNVTTSFRSKVTTESYVTYCS